MFILGIIGIMILIRSRLVNGVISGFFIDSLMLTGGVYLGISLKILY